MWRQQLLQIRDSLLQLHQQWPLAKVSPVANSRSRNKRKGGCKRALALATRQNLSGNVAFAQAHTVMTTHTRVGECAKPVAARTMRFYVDLLCVYIGLHCWMSTYLFAPDILPIGFAFLSTIGRFECVLYSAAFLSSTDPRAKLQCLKPCEYDLGRGAFATAPKKACLLNLAGLRVRLLNGDVEKNACCPKMH